MRELALAFLPNLLAAADEVELEDGKVVEGKVEDLGDSIRLVRSGFSVTYPKHLVRRIEYKKTPEETYAERARALRDDDLEGHLRLARWCLEKKLAAEARAEFLKVVAADPDHEEARAGLGQRLHAGQWMTEDQIREARGQVRYKGCWMTPEERDLEAALEERKELEQKLLREVRLQMDRLRSSDPRKREEARQALAGIEDRYKTQAYLAAVGSGPLEVRRHAIEELGRMKEPAAVRPLARSAVWDEDPTLRACALRALEAIRHPDTALHLVPFLGEESVGARIRCAEALALFPDLRAVPPLLEALENTLETLRAAELYAEQVTAVVNRTLVLRDGTRITLPQVVRVRAESLDRPGRERLAAEKAALLRTLRAVTGQDFGEDLARWRAWIRKPR